MMKNKRLFAILTLVCFMFTFMPMAAMAEGSTVDAWDGSIDTSWTADQQITTAGQLAYFAQLVNAGNTFEGKTIKLAADIDLANESWTPIGQTVGSTHYFFKGNFDGQNHTIFNLNVTADEDAGLFGYVVEGSVKNVKLDGVKIIGSLAGGSVAGTVGYGAVIDNCHATEVEITLEPRMVGSVYDDGNNAGGIVGVINGYQYKAGAVTNCSAADVVIAAYRDAGGAIGTVNATDGTIDITGTTASNVTITIDQVSKFYAEKAINAGLTIGRALNLDKSETEGDFALDAFPSKATDETSISTKEGLYKLAELVNAGNTFEGKTIKLAADIDLANESWTPIGQTVGSTHYFFKGNFDGQNHTIFNLNVTADEDAGLFGYVVEGSVKNVKLNGVEINGSLAGGSVAGTVGYGAVIDNCHATGVEITLEPRMVGSVYDDGNNAGGIVGVINGYQHKAGAVTNCSAADVVIAAYRDAGGAIGTVNATDGTIDITGTTASNVTITIDQVSKFYAEKAINAGLTIGRALNLDKSETEGDFELIIVKKQTPDTPAPTYPTYSGGGAVAPSTPKVETETVVTPSGTKVETTTETTVEGTKVETVTTTTASGETSTTVTATLQNGSAVTNTDAKVEVEVEKVSYATMNKAEEAVAADENVEVVGTADNAISVSATSTSTGAAQTDFAQPMSVSVPVDNKVLNNVTDTSKLTLAKVVTNADGTTSLEYMGGSYDKETGTFNAKVDEDGDYILVEKADLVKIDLTIGDETVKHNDKHHELDTAPKIDAETGRTELPLRYLGEALGFTIDWNNNVVTITKDGASFSITIGEEIPGFGKPYVDGNDRTMVSARYIAEKLGANVIWDPATRQVTVVK